MRRSVPLLPTLVVLIAVGVMIGLGVWQLRRGAEKEAMLTRYAAALTSEAEVPWPSTESAIDSALYRRSRLLCLSVKGRRSIAGRNAADDAGIAQYAQCVLPDGSTAQVVMGWSRNPAEVGDWIGGQVRGIVAPGPRLVADPPLGGLVANSLPNPSELPNGHMAYAIQWFIFAVSALVIYALALWKRARRSERPKV